MASIGISDVVTASVYEEVHDDENDNYFYYYYHYWRASETLSGVYNLKIGDILWCMLIARACHLEFVSIESYLKAISSDYGSNKEY